MIIFRVMVGVIRDSSPPNSLLKVRVNLREVSINYKDALRTIITLR